MIIRRIFNRANFGLVSSNISGISGCPQYPSLKLSNQNYNKLTYYKTQYISSEKPKDVFDIEDILNELGKKGDQQYEEPFVQIVYFSH
jgi:hypothetical protein